MRSARVVAFLSGCLLLSTAGRADEVRSEKYPRPLLHGPEKEAPRPNKWWELNARLGVASDSNINHLLVNSALESNLNRPDTIVRSGAGFSLNPAPSKSVKAELSYAFDRYDYSQNTIFSYYSHEISGDLYPRISRRWSLDLGGDLDWVADKNGAIANDRTGRTGVVWYGPARLKVKAGFEYRRDSVTINPQKNGDTRAVYVSMSRRVFADHLAFGGYRYQAHSTAGADFSYRAHAVRLGFVGRLTPAFKLTGFASYADKAYDNVDSRFHVRRRDKAFSATLRPSLTLVEGLSAVASLTYARNFSNVGIKEYSDRQIFIGLEGRF